MTARRVGVWTLVALGAALRLDQYLLDRSLWIDEAFAAVDVHKPFLDMLADPDYGLLTPHGFLAATKLMTTLFGPHDLVLRLVPLACGLAAMVAFPALARATVSGAALLPAVFLFAISPSLIYYASEYKPYGPDSAIAIGLMLLALATPDAPLTRARMTVLAAAGAAAVWMSYPVCFVLGAVWAYVAVAPGRWRHRGDVLRLVAVAGVWLASFALMYRLTLQGTEATPGGRIRVGFWWFFFMPPPWDPVLFDWLRTRFVLLFDYTVDLETSDVAVVLAVVGAIALWRARARAALLLTAPILLAMLASGLHKWGFGGRLMLFAAPGLILLLAEGITRVRLSSRGATIAAHLFLVACLLSYPYVYQRQARRELKTVMRQMAAHDAGRDVLYAYYWAEPSVRYYAGLLGWRESDCRVVSPIPVDGARELDDFRRRHRLPIARVEDTRCILGISPSVADAWPELERLRGRGRVWLVFSYADLEEGAFVSYLDSLGTRRLTLRAGEAVAYLYDL